LFTAPAASDILKRITDCAHATSQVASHLFIHTCNNQQYLGPWSKLASVLSFGHGDAARLRTAAPPNCILSSETDNFVGITAYGLAALCAKTGHARDLFLAAAEGPQHVCLVRALCRWFLAPSATPAHPLLDKPLRHYTHKNASLVAEADILALFGERTLDHPERNVYVGLPASARVICDSNKRAVVTGTNSSKHRLWALSADAARACLMAMLDRKFDASSWDKQTMPPFFHALLASSQALFHETYQLQQAQRARIDWAAQLLTTASIQLSMLSLAERADLALNGPLQAMAQSLGDLARQRSAPIASEMVTQQRTGELSPLSIIGTTNAEYLAQHSEPVTVSFLTAAMGTHSAGASSGPLPNITSQQRAETKAMTALVSISDAVLHSVNPKCHPPLANAIAQDMATVSCMSLLLCCVPAVVASLHLCFPQCIQRVRLICWPRKAQARGRTVA
jgi:hypothetical protein